MVRSGSQRGAASGIGATELDVSPESAAARRRPGGLPTHLSLRRQVAVVAMWPLIEQLMASLVGWVDTALAGHLPIEAVESTNAVSVASFTTWLMGLCQG